MGFRPRPLLVTAAWAVNIFRFFCGILRYRFKGEISLVLLVLTCVLTRGQRVITSRPSAGQRAPSAHRLAVGAVLAKSQRNSPFLYDLERRNCAGCFGYGVCQPGSKYHRTTIEVSAASYEPCLGVPWNTYSSGGIPMNLT